MSFNEKSETLINTLIQAEYENACNQYGEKFNSIHEAYAILKEELEETMNELNTMNAVFDVLWLDVKGDNIEPLNKLISNMKSYQLKAMKELAQVGAVLLKFKNTIKNKNKVCDSNCEHFMKSYGKYFCLGQKNMPEIDLGNECVYNNR